MSKGPKVHKVSLHRGHHDRPRWLADAAQPIMDIDDMSNLSDPLLGLPSNKSGDTAVQVTPGQEWEQP